MKNYFLIIFGLLFYNICVGQVPGGVKGMHKWYVTADTTHPSFRDRLTGNVIPIINQAGMGRLNYQPANIFSGFTRFDSEISAQDMNTTTYFTVYKAIDAAKENIIWHLSRDTTVELVLTTNRMADLKDIRYMNFLDRFPLNPKVNVYLHQKIKDTQVSSFKWHIGYKPLTPNLPVYNLKGLIPEIILYKRVLSWEEMLKVSSYLALKYGITLSEPDATYVNSKGDIIWNGYSYTEYHNNIAGLIRDDSSGLVQKMATSGNGPEFLSISTADSLSNLSSLIWGDNNKELITEEKMPAMPQMLQRKWLMITFGKTEKTSTTLKVNTNLMDVAVPVKPVYWLAKDMSGTGNFLLSSTEYIRMASLDNGIANFSNVTWNDDSSRKTAFGFVAGPSLLLSGIISEPVCSNSQSGIITIKQWGAQLPGRLTLTNTTTAVTRSYELKDTSAITINGLGAGKYVLYAIDRDLNRYTDSFYINYTDAPRPKSLKPWYELKKDETLSLDAAVGMPPGMYYEWTGPAGFYSTRSAVEIKNTGTYKLSVSTNGCAYVQEIVVKHPAENIFRHVIIYPNPSKGSFTAKLLLEKQTHLRMQIYTEDGRLVKTEELNGFANYTINGELEYNGVYIIVFSAGKNASVHKLEVIR